MAIVVIASRQMLIKLRCKYITLYLYMFHSLQGKNVHGDAWFSNYSSMIVVQFGVGN